MKIMLAIALVALFTLMGYIISSKYYFRKQFFTDFYNFNNKLKQEINFRQTTLFEILKESNNSDFYYTLKNYVKNNTFEFNKSYINKDEIEYFYNYLKILGTGDKDSQIDFLDKIDINIIEKQKQSIIDENKYKQLYIKLGFLIGLIIFILFL